MLFFLFLLNSNKFINNIRPRKVEDTRSGIFAMLAHWLTNEIILKMKINIIWGDDATPVGHSANWNYSQHNPNMWFPESVWCNPTISIHVFFFFYIKSAIPFNCAAHPRKITSTFCDIPTAFHFSLTVHNIHSYYIQTLRVIHIYYSHCVELCRLYYIIIPILEMESSGLQFGSWCDKIILNVQAKL